MKRTISLIIATLMILATIPFASLSAMAEPDVPQIDEYVEKDDTTLGTIKLMPLGDSITEAYDIPGGWRIPLKLWLEQAGIKTDFVGPNTNSPDAVKADDPQHCGYGGYRLRSESSQGESIYHKVTGWMTTYKPDVVTLAAGINDIWWDNTINTQGLRDVLDRIFAVDPDVKVFVSSVTNVDTVGLDKVNWTYPDNFNDKIDQLNATIPGVVEEYSKKGYSVYFADVASVIVPEEDLADGVHPHQNGYKKMAAKWYSEMIDVMLTLNGQYEDVAQGNSTATEAVDGKNTTVWTADASGEAPYIEVKFDEEQTIGRYLVKHAAKAGYDSSYNTTAFTLKASSDGVNWTTVDSVTGLTGDKTDRFVGAFTAKYVRLYIDEAGADDVARVAEFRLYGPKTLQDSFYDLTYTNSKYSHSMPYRLYVPENYDPAESYPMVVVFHGAGERGNDNESHITAHESPLVWAQPEVQKDNPCFVVAAQCPTNELWVDTPWDKGSYDLDSVPISDEMQMVVDIIDLISGYYNIDTTRLYSTGISMGGYATWNINMLYPDLFAAMAPICGGADPSKASLLADKPIWAFHGGADSVVPVSGTREMVEALKAEGSDVIYTEYEGMDHNVWDKAYATPELIDWMFAQSNNSETNVAVNSNVTVSNSFANEPGSKAVDGTTSSVKHNNSKWCGNSGATDWLVMDLGEECTISRWQLYLAGAGGENDIWNAKEFKLQYSNNGTTWTDVDNVKDNVSDMINRYIPSTTARYWRLYLTTKTNNTDTAARVYEIELYENNDYTKYNVSVDSVIGGTADVTVNNDRAMAGENVTVTVSNIQAGLKVASVIVTGPDGTVIETTADGNNQYSFNMPAGNATVSVELAIDESLKMELFADKELSLPGDNITLTTVLPDSVTKVGIVNENGKYISKVSESCVPAQDEGYNVWTIVIAPATVGTREFTLATMVNGGTMTATDAKCSVLISKNLPSDKSAVEIIAVDTPINSLVNDVFTITVETSCSATNVGIYNADNGKAMGKVSQTYSDKDGVRTWKISLKVGTKGIRNFNVKASDVYGNWTEDAEEFTINIYQLII